MPPISAASIQVRRLAITFKITTGEDCCDRRQATGCQTSDGEWGAAKCHRDSCHVTVRSMRKNIRAELPGSGLAMIVAVAPPNPVGDVQHPPSDRGTECLSRRSWLRCSQYCRQLHRSIRPRSTKSTSSCCPLVSIPAACSITPQQQAAEKERQRRASNTRKRRRPDSPIAPPRPLSLNLW